MRPLPAKILLLIFEHSRFRLVRKSQLVVWSAIHLIPEHAHEERHDPGLQFVLRPRIRVSIQRHRSTQDHRSRSTHPYAADSQRRTIWYTHPQSFRDNCRGGVSGTSVRSRGILRNAPLIYPLTLKPCPPLAGAFDLMKAAITAKITTLHYMIPALTTSTSRSCCLHVQS